VRPDGDGSDGEVLAAGNFSAWTAQMLGAMGGERVAVVPCGGCTACCTASQFVEIGPDEADTLARIPAELLVPAPRRPHGHVVLGYDERGHCPMLVGGGCSIYDHRPRACRTYDCRIFAAAGLLPDGDDKVLIARRARRWRFDYPTEADRHRHDAVRAASSFLSAHTELLPDGAEVTNPAYLAGLALEIHDLFLGGTGEAVDPDAVRSRLRGRTARPAQ
jgi:hypothetical protein